MRGSRIQFCLFLCRDRSIPASAGQPPPAAISAIVLEVYPRECGAASSASGSGGPVSGLSPRVRGSHGLSRRFQHRCGSIPASAGQPTSQIPVISLWAVYPRECGAARARVWDSIEVEGLSPRVRGSQAITLHQPYATRSIPASAGQPRHGLDQAPGCQVYPRECGAAYMANGSANSPPGLSPRVRGSPTYPPDRAAWLGSIPASAGQPDDSTNASRPTAVYPRECGAALVASVRRD